MKAKTREITFDNGLFLAGVAGYLRGMEPEAIPQDGKYLDEPAFKQAIDMSEIYYGKLWNGENYGDAITALSAFKEWLDGTEWQYAEPKLYHANNYTISMTMVAPSGSLTIGVNIDILTDDTSAALKKARLDLQAELKKAFAAAFNKPLDETKPENKKRRSNDEQEYETEEAHIDTLRVKKQPDGKLYVSAIPDEGRWQQYGVPLYKDVADKFDIDLPKKSGEYDVDWHIVYELKPDGKPRRVIEIVDNETPDD